MFHPVYYSAAYLFHRPLPFSGNVKSHPAGGFLHVDIVSRLPLTVYSILRHRSSPNHMAIWSGTSKIVYYIGKVERGKTRAVAAFHQTVHFIKVSGNPFYTYTISATYSIHLRSGCFVQEHAVHHVILSHTHSLLNLPVAVFLIKRPDSSFFSHVAVLYFHMKTAPPHTP